MSGAAVCAACPTTLPGGECPRCGTYWTHDENGELMGVRPGSLSGVYAARIVRPGGSVPEIDPLLAEAYCALNALWMNLVFGGKILSEQQAEALRYVSTPPRREWSSRELADALSVSHQAAANVLSILVGKGLLRSTRRGRAVRYSLAQLWPTGDLMRAAGLWRAKQRSETTRDALAAVPEERPEAPDDPLAILGDGELREHFLAMTTEMARAHNPDPLHPIGRCTCGYPEKPCLRIMLRNGPPFPARPCEPVPEERPPVEPEEDPPLQDPSRRPEERP